MQLTLKLNGLYNQRVTLSDGSTGEFVWDDGINASACYFQSYYYVGFEVPKTAIRNGTIIQSADDSITYRIRIAD